MAVPREQFQRVRRMSEAAYAATVVIVNQDPKKGRL